MTIMAGYTSPMNAIKHHHHHQQQQQQHQQQQQQPDRQQRRQKQEQQPRPRQHSPPRVGGGCCGGGNATTAAAAAAAATTTTSGVVTPCAAAATTNAAAPAATRTAADGGRRNDRRERIRGDGNQNGDMRYGTDDDNDDGGDDDDDHDDDDEEWDRNTLRMTVGMPWRESYWGDGDDDKDRRRQEQHQYLRPCDVVWVPELFGKEQNRTAFRDLLEEYRNHERTDGLRRCDRNGTDDDGESAAQVEGGSEKEGVVPTCRQPATAETRNDTARMEHHEPPRRRDFDVLPYPSPTVDAVSNRVCRYFGIDPGSASVYLVCTGADRGSTGTTGASRRTPPPPPPYEKSRTPPSSSGRVVCRFRCDRTDRTEARGGDDDDTGNGPRDEEITHEPSKNVMITATFGETRDMVFTRRCLCSREEREDAKEPCHCRCWRHRPARLRVALSNNGVVCQSRHVKASWTKRIEEGIPTKGTLSSWEFSENHRGDEISSIDITVIGHSSRIREPNLTRATPSTFGRPPFGAESYCSAAREGSCNRRPSFLAPARDRGVRPTDLETKRVANDEQAADGRKRLLAIFDDDRNDNHETATNDESLAVDCSRVQNATIDDNKVRRSPAAASPIHDPSFRTDSHSPCREGSLADGNATAAVTDGTAHSEARRALRSTTMDSDEESLLAPTKDRAVCQTDPENKRIANDKHSADGCKWLLAIFDDDKNDNHETVTNDESLSEDCSRVQNASIDDDKVRRLTTDSQIHDPPFRTDLHTRSRERSLTDGNATVAVTDGTSLSGACSALRNTTTDNDEESRPRTASWIRNPSVRTDLHAPRRETSPANADGTLAINASVASEKPRCGIRERPIFDILNGELASKRARKQGEANRPGRCERKSSSIQSATTNHDRGGILSREEYLKKLIVRYLERRGGSEMINRLGAFLSDSKPSFQAQESAESALEEIKETYVNVYTFIVNQLKNDMILVDKNKSGLYEVRLSPQNDGSQPEKPTDASRSCHSDGAAMYLKHLIISYLKENGGNGEVSKLRDHLLSKKPSSTATAICSAYQELKMKYYSIYNFIQCCCSDEVVSTYAKPGLHLISLGTCSAGETNRNKFSAHHLKKIITEYMKTQGGKGDLIGIQDRLKQEQSYDVSAFNRTYGSLRSFFLQHLSKEIMITGRKGEKNFQVIFTEESSGARANHRPLSSSSGRKRTTSLTYKNNPKRTKFRKSV